MNERLAHVFERSDELIERANQRKRDAYRRHIVTVKTCAVRHRAKRMGALSTLTTEEWRQIVERYGYRCLRCRRSFRLDDLTIDHIKPMCKGGRNTADNVQPLCDACNRKKHKRTIDYRDNT